MAYKLESPNAVYVKHRQDTDVRPISVVLQDEGCPRVENRFTAEDLCIALDAIQQRTAQRNHTSPRASADLLLCVEKRKILFADAKFRCKSVKNIDRKEVSDKRKESKAMITDESYQVLNDFFLLFKGSVLKDTQKNYLKRIFANKPSTHFLTAIEFAELFGR